MKGDGEMKERWWNNEDTLDERQEYAYEVHPTEIAERLCAKARESEPIYYWHPTKEDEEQITDIIYDLHSVCCNQYNRDGYRKFYKLLCVVSHELGMEG